MYARKLEGERMKNIVLGLLLVLGLVGCNKTASVKNEGKRYASTVILGTYSWDVETNTLGPNRQSDFWWQRVDETTGNLVAQNGTTVEVVTNDFETTDKSYISQLPALRDGRISHQHILPGTVALFKTAEGHYGKLRIKGYRALHDFDFKEAREYLDDTWKEYVLRKPNNEKYHLVVEYVLYN